ncbi:DUF2254 family protein [Candidatus Nitrosocosmicus hydrocola]|uniref:DUF2254 family protein n=1 Tax=Candidatus Nitrosocosmicus hydrocola TaxID=1826872 RepID=UPI0039C885A4
MSVLRNKWLEFSKSILYYPVLFIIGSFSLFMITSRIDPLIPTDMDLSIFNPLIFTGSPDAARSILSAIAAGWTTILGVAFSVTLITLQLSSSKYLSRLVTEFQNDKINQFALGWFIFISSYSLLTLKTVITEESNGIFIPILGTNISIGIAIAGLLVFVLYIHNISNYLRPNILISRIVDNIISSFKKYENRKTDKKFDIDKKSLTEEILSIRSPDTGIMSSVNWKKVQDSLLQYETEEDLWMEWFKSIGDWANKGEKLAVIYRHSKIDKYQSLTNESIRSSTENGNDYKNKSGKDDDDKTKEAKSEIDNNISHISNHIASSIQVIKDSNLSEDPVLGIKLLEQISLKSNKLGDYDVVNSLIIGLYRILIFVYFNEPKLGLPFTSSDKDKKTQKVRKISLRSKFSDMYYHTSIDNKNNKTGSKETDERRGENHQMQGDGNEYDKDQKNRTIIINPKELKIQDVILDVFKNLFNAIYKQANYPSNELFCKQYISACNYLLENNKIGEFEILTEWYSYNITSLIKEYSEPALIIPTIELLSEFKQVINLHYPFARLKYSMSMDKVMDYKPRYL